MKHAKGMAGTLRILAIWLLLAMVLPGAASGQEAPRGFDTQEACALAVAEAIRSGDTEAFLNCYAIEETARSYNLTAHVERLRALFLNNASMLMQPSNAWNVAYNRAKLTNDLLRSLTFSSIALSSPEGEKAVVSMAPVTEKNSTIEQMVTMAEAGEVLSRLTYQRLIDPETLSQNYAKVFEKQSYLFAVYGMKDWEEKVMILQLDGRTVYMAAGFVRYDGGWLLRPVTATIQMTMGVPSQLLLVSEDML